MNIELKHITTSYGSRTITRDLTATIRGGEVTCVLGPNGAGKSTLIRAIMNMDRQNIAVVLTDRIDIPNLTVRELVGMGRMPHTGFFGTLSEKDYAIVDKALLSVGCCQLSERYVNTLSDGERQKVMIAKALAQETPAILLDEPTAFLDFPSKVEVMQLLRNLAHKNGKCIFLSTHDINLALKLADCLWLMHNETVIQGSPDELMENGSLTHFLGKSIEYL